MASSRAAEVAEILWELKRADKVATYSVIARRAGFSAGTNGRSVQTALKTVRRDWGHLQWWRAIHDACVVENGSEHQEKLIESGFEFETAAEDAVDDNIKKTFETPAVLKAADEHLMQWEPAEGEAAAADEAAADGEKE